MSRRFPWIRQSLVIWHKELRIEFRTRFAYSTLLMFAVTTLITISFSVGGFVPDSDITAALLWIILFFSAMAGLGRTFVQEEEKKTVTALKLAVAPEPVFLGKYLFNVTLLCSLTVLVVPLFLVLLNQSVPQWPPFLVTVILGVLGLAGASTIIAAIVAKAEAKSAMMTILAFPVLVPLLLAAINATRACLAGASGAAPASELYVLLFYNGAVLTASLLLFEYIWNE